MSELADYVRILGRGPGRARNLTEAEAEEAFSLILSGEAAPEAIGALLMLMRYRGEDAAEIAGFTRALRTSLPKWSGETPAVDWPSYAAGRSRGLPLFLLSAKLVARAGYSVLLHGWNSHQSTGADLRSALPVVEIAQARNAREAAAQLATDGISYLPVEVLSPRLLELLRLRDVLGLRSCLNTVSRMMNPGGAQLSVQGVFHPSYRALQRDAARLLGQPVTLTVKGAGGEFERNPAKPIEVVGQEAGKDVSRIASPLLTASTRLAEGPALPVEPESLTRLWEGSSDDPFAEACVLGTAALVLRGLEPECSDEDALVKATRLWEQRHTIPEGVPA